MSGKSLMLRLAPGQSAVASDQSLEEHWLNTENGMSVVSNIRQFFLNCVVVL